jgi:hypothetical protein
VDFETFFNIQEMQPFTDFVVADFRHAEPERKVEEVRYVPAITGDGVRRTLPDPEVSQKILE